MNRPLIKILRKYRSGLSLTQIAHALRLPPQDRQALKKRLARLEESGAVFRMKRKYFSVSGLDVIRGTYAITQWGKGFVIPDSGEAYVRIAAANTGGALHGDRVEAVSKSLGKKGRPEGLIVQILSEGSPFVIGEYRPGAGAGCVRPLNAAQPEMEIKKDEKIAGDDALKSGILVLADRHTRKVKEVLGHPHEGGADISAVIRKYRLPEAFSGAAAEAEALPAKISPADMRGRVDLRNRPVFTLDTRGAQDFDDAVDIERTSDGFRIAIHISDVSHYVAPGSEMDNEAFERGTSVYFPDRALNMFPERLSGEIASLLPGQDRLAVSVFLTMDESGVIVRQEFCPSVIRSRLQLSYPDAARILHGENRRIQNISEDLKSELFLMRDAARLLRAKRMEAGGLNFDLEEPTLFSLEGESFMESPEVLEAGGIIEDFMIAANESVASFLESKDCPLIYRIHPPPSPEAVGRLKSLTEALDIFLPLQDLKTARHLQAVIDRGKGKPFEKIIVMSVLRSLRRACYSTRNEGHFGLGKRIYTHFTSPIRRYADLIIQRLLKKCLRGETTADVFQPDTAVAVHCTCRQKTADDAQRDLTEWRAYRFLQKKTGHLFPGMVVEIAKAGLVVALEDIGYYVEGFVPFSLCGESFATELPHQATGKRSGKIFRIGQRISVFLRDVDDIRRKVTFDIQAG